MATLVPTLMGRLERAFEAHRDADRAVAQARYMRDRFTFYGIDAPTQKVIAREAAVGLTDPDQRQLARLANDCWMREEREWQYVACWYLRRHIDTCGPGFIEVTQRLITSKSWWDTVDALAPHVAGAQVRRFPELVERVDRWIDDDDVWLVRSALLHQLASKHETDAARLFAYCRRQAGHSEFFVRKAIGWALRTYSRIDGPAVRRFVADHADELSGLSRREALTWLDRRRPAGRTR